MKREIGVNHYRQVITLDDVPDRQLRNILAQLLDHLHIQIIREQTPDYTIYELFTNPDQA